MEFQWSKFLTTTSASDHILTAKHGKEHPAPSVSAPDRSDPGGRLPESRLQIGVDNSSSIRLTGAGAVEIATTTSDSAGTAGANLHLCANTGEKARTTMILDGVTRVEGLVPSAMRWPRNLGKHMTADELAEWYNGQHWPTAHSGGALGVICVNNPETNQLVACGFLPAGTDLRVNAQRPEWAPVTAEVVGLAQQLGGVVDRTNLAEVVGALYLGGEVVFAAGELPPEVTAFLDLEA